MPIDMLASPQMNRISTRKAFFALDALEELPDLSDSSIWVRREDLPGLHLKHPDQYGVIDEYLRELETGIVPKFRQPWEQREWFRRAEEEQQRTRGELDVFVLQQVQLVEDAVHRVPR